VGTYVWVVWSSVCYLALMAFMRGLCVTASLCGRLMCERGTCLSLLWCHWFVTVLGLFIDL
jgi:hypothetical protein